MMMPTDPTPDLVVIESRLAVAGLKHFLDPGNERVKLTHLGAK
jgi:hypothetical protein